MSMVILEAEEIGIKEDGEMATRIDEVEEWFSKIGMVEGLFLKPVFDNALNFKEQNET